MIKKTSATAQNEFKIGKFIENNNSVIYEYEISFLLQNILLCENVTDIKANRAYLINNNQHASRVLRAAGDVCLCDDDNVALHSISYQQPSITLYLSAYITATVSIGYLHILRRGYKERMFV